MQGNELWFRRGLLLVLPLPSLIVGGFAINAWLGGCIVIGFEWVECGVEAARLFLVCVALHFFTVPLMFIWLIVAAVDRWRTP
jgi:hypothetical protein